MLLRVFINNCAMLRPMNVNVYSVLIIDNNKKK